MSATGWEGRKLQIALGGVILAACKSKSVNFSTDPIDISDGERNGFRRLAERGDVMAAQVQVDGVATRANYDVLRELWHGDAWGELTILNPDGSVIPSRAFLAGMDSSGERDGFVTFSATFLLDMSVFSYREAVEQGADIGGSGGGSYPPTGGTGPGGGGLSLAPEYVTSNEYSTEPPPVDESGMDATGVGSVAEGAAVADYNQGEFSYGGLDEAVEYPETGEFEGATFHVVAIYNRTNWDPPYFAVAVRGLAGVHPPADVIESITINGTTKDSADCADVGVSNPEAFAGIARTYTYVPNPGVKDRVWEWPAPLITWPEALPGYPDTVHVPVVLVLP